MDCSIPDSGIPAEALGSYIEEQIFTLPGVADPRRELTILLTGRRATGTHTPRSDVDIEVLCGREVYTSIQQAMLAQGRIRTSGASFYVLQGDEYVPVSDGPVLSPPPTVTLAPTGAATSAEGDD